MNRSFTLVLGVVLCALGGPIGCSGDGADDGSGDGGDTTSEVVGDASGTADTTGGGASEPDGGGTTGTSPDADNSSGLGTEADAGATSDSGSGNCTPACVGQSCGDDGCGGSCGECADGDTCNAMGACEGPSCTSNSDCVAGLVCKDGECMAAPCEEDADCPFEQLCQQGACSVNPNVCSGNLEGELQPFGGACCYTTPTHPNNPNCIWSAEGYTSDCMDNQCETSICSGGSSGRYCSKGCTFYDDSVNNDTGEPGTDGVVDPLQPDDCVAGFPADGPFGTNYRCVNLRSPDKDPYGLCRPGTTFRKCLGDSDCPDGEACNVLYIMGESEKRCMTRVKDGGAGGDACNTDPAAGEVNYCGGPFCFGFGCVDTCGEEDDCATDVCVDGLCAKDSDFCVTNADCSATTCDEMTPYSDSDFTEDFCLSKNCTVIGECGDPDWFCRPYWNGASAVEDVALDPSCRRIEEGSVGYGEACGYEDDGSGLPPCAWYYGCFDGVCTGPCTSDDDCSDGLACIRGTEWSIDVDDDDVVDTYVDVDVCMPWPQNGGTTVCETDADCASGEHCEYRIVSELSEDGSKTWGAEFVCREDYEDQVEFGEICGTGIGECASDLCLVPSGSTTDNSMCTTYCESASDCPETFEFDGVFWKSICLSFNVGHNGTPDPIDDIYVPYCWRASSFGSLAPCTEDRKCDAAKDYCDAIAIAGNPDEAVTVEHLCRDANYGLDTLPTKEVGEPCSSWQECKGRTCLADGDGGGYCSELCTTDAGCQNPDSPYTLKCTTETLIARPDDTLSGKTQRCRLAATCLVCESDDDCGGDYVCINMGGLGESADMRCGEPCMPSQGCDDPDASECTQHITSVGQPTDSHACMPVSCN
ncbi:MAG: hypothetical protein ACPGU1_00655 [Myxococcota bacterium]